MVDNKLVRYFVKRHPFLKGVPYELRMKVWKRIAVNEEFLYLYVRIPKAANSTIVRTLAKETYPGLWPSIAPDKTAFKSKQLFSRFSPFSCLTKNCVYKKYYLFSFFRNPYERTLSAFLDKMRSDDNNEKFDKFAQHMGRDGRKRVSFRDFVSFLETEGLLSNIHWAPQMVLLPVPLNRLNYVGYVETIDKDIDNLFPQLFPSEGDLRLATREHNRQKASSRLGQYFSSDLTRRVFELYREDFQCLGYKKELPS